MTPKIKKNLIWLLSGSTLNAAAISFSGSVLTPFFLRCGMSEGQISVYLSFLQVVNLIFPLFIAGLAAECRNSRRYAALWRIVCAALTMLFAIFCAVTVDVRLFFAMMLLIGGTSAMATAIQNVYEYKVPCEVIDLQYYTVYSARSGIFIGIVGILIGFLLPYLYTKLPYMLVTGIAFATAGILMGLSALTFICMKPLKADNADEDTSDTQHTGKLPFHPIRDFIRLLSNPDFRFLVLPNLGRGIGNGLISLIPVIALRESILTEENAAILTSAAKIATLLSCLVYTRMVVRIGLARTCLIGGLVLAILPLTVFGSTIWFLIAYGIAYIGYYIVSMVIPNMMYRAIHEDIISIYNTWRLTLNTVGSVVSTMLLGFLMPYLPSAVLIAIGTAGYLLCTLGHYAYYRKKI